MQYDTLAAYFRTRQQDIIDRVIGAYLGPFSFGIIHEPGQPGDASCLQLSVPDDASPSNFPKILDVDGEPVKIVVAWDFTVPTAPQTRKRRAT